MKLMESFQGVDPARATVADILHNDTYVVEPDAQTDDVVRTMADRKFGSAVIMDNHKVVGIFTTVDALRAFADTLDTLLHK